jgi:methylmalonyl-CoA mutase cobalamin-binding subunit
MGLIGAALRLQQLGFQVTYLGARTPAGELARAAAELRPDVVAVSAINDQGARAFRSQISQIVRALPAPTRLVVGGAAAERHADVCRALGVTLMPSPESWEQLARA